MSLVGPITLVGRPWFGPTRGSPPWHEPWHTPRSQSQPLDPSVLGLNGSNTYHMDPWAHMEASKCGTRLNFGQHFT